MAALGELVAEGKVRYIGNANFTGWQIADAAHVARAAGAVPFISAQNHWSQVVSWGTRTDVPTAAQSGSPISNTQGSNTQSGPVSQVTAPVSDLTSAAQQVVEAPTAALPVQAPSLPTAPVDLPKVPVLPPPPLP